MRTMSTFRCQREVSLRYHLSGDDEWIIAVCVKAIVSLSTVQGCAQPIKYPSEATGSVIVLRLVIRVQDDQ